MEKSKPSQNEPWLYICLDSKDDQIEQEILGKNGFCRTKMLGATCAAELDENVLKQADVVAVWHTIFLDASLLKKLAKPPKVKTRIKILIALQ
jgi:hypothetical protein